MRAGEDIKHEARLLLDHSAVVMRLRCGGQAWTCSIEELPRLRRHGRIDPPYHMAHYNVVQQSLTLAVPH